MSDGSPPPRAPRAARHPHRTTLHGDVRDDPYAWLRDDHWRDVMRDPARLNPDIRAYLEAENAYAEAVMAPAKALRNTLFEEMKGRIREDESSVPMPDGPYLYYERYRPGGEHPLYCRRARSGGGEQILFDGDKAARGRAYFDIGAWRHSPDHRLLAVSTDNTGAEYFAITIRDLRTEKAFGDRLERTAGHMEWAADGHHLFYVRLDDDHRPREVYRHRLGTPASEDVLIYREADPGFFVTLKKTESGRFLLICCHDHETSEVHLIPAGDPGRPPVCLAPRRTGIEYEVTDIGDRFFIRTNADGAEDFKIVQAPIATPGPDHWRDFVPSRQGHMIIRQLAFKDFHVCLERRHALPRIVIRRLHGRQSPDEHEIAFEEEAFSLGLIPGFEFDTSVLRFRYASPTTPQKTFDYDMKTRQRILRKTQDVPSGHDPDEYVARRLFITADDGARIPVTLLHHRRTRLDGSAPLLLYGYGAYGHAIPAGFSTSRLSLVDRGFVYAIAHVRGGDDLGRQWYRLGKREHKQNTFSDFIAVAKGLIERKITGRGKIIAQGGSAGGMLIGAVANQAPDLFHGLIAEVPFVDVLNTMCDASLPLTPPEWPEWGNPLEDRDAYDRIKAYSPYDNVTAQAYPHMLVTAGLTDPRVTYWEPAKWVAKLRATKTDDHLLLLKTQMKAGHAGASGRFEHLKETALVYAFALMISQKVPGSAAA